MPLQVTSHILFGSITILESAYRLQDICDLLFKFSALDLQKRFVHLLDRVEEGFNVLISKEKDILLQVSQFLEVYPKITGSSKVHDSTDIFSRVRAYSDFLSYKLLVVLTREFLKDEVKIQEELEKYVLMTRQFEELLKIQNFENVMAFLPWQEETTMAIATYLVFKLNRLWSTKTLKNIHSLCSYLFSDNQRYLSHMTIDIIEEVPCIKFLIANSTHIIEDLISEAAKKRELMYLLGVFEMMINNIPVLMGNEDKSFTFESALQKSSQSSNNEAVQFLLDSGVDINIEVASHASQEDVLLLPSESADTSVHIEDEDTDYNGWTPLIHASRKGYYNSVEILLQIPVDPNVQDFYGKSALMYASQNGHYQIVDILLKKCADPNIRNNNGRTALILASHNGHYQVIEILLEKEADPNVRDNNGCTALMYASENGYQQVAELLAKQKIDLDIQDYTYGRTALIQASISGHYQAVEILLKKGADPNIHDNNGWTALIIASENGHRQVVEILLEKGVDPNVQNGEQGVTALIQASISGHYQVVEMLLKKGADPNTRGSTMKMTALMFACFNGYSNIIEILLCYKANPHICGSQNVDSFGFAVIKGDIEILKIFLKHTKWSLQNTSMGWHCACQHGRVPIITFLSNRLEIDPDRTDLIISCVEGDLGSVVDQLMSGKITPHVQFVHGVTPLMISSSCGHTDIVEALITAGVNINKTDEFGCTAVDFAEEAEQDATMNILLQHGGVKGPGSESESHEDLLFGREETTSEEQKLSTDTNRSTIKSSQDSLSIRKEELELKKKLYLSMKKLFKDIAKYNRNIFSPQPHFDNTEYSNTTTIASK